MNQEGITRYYMSLDYMSLDGFSVHGHKIQPKEDCKDGEWVKYNDYLNQTKELQEQLKEVTELNNSQCGRINSDKEVKDMLRNEVKLLKEQLVSKDKEITELKNIIEGLYEDKAGADI